MPPNGDTAICDIFLLLPTCRLDACLRCLIPLLIELISRKKEERVNQREAWLKKEEWSIHLKLDSQDFISSFVNQLFYFLLIQVSKMEIRLFLCPLKSKIDLSGRIFFTIVWCRISIPVRIRNKGFLGKRNIEYAVFHRAVTLVFCIH